MDSNPRGASQRRTAFKAGPIGLSGSAPMNSRTGNPPVAQRPGSPLLSSIAPAWRTRARADIDFAASRALWHAPAGRPRHLKARTLVLPCSGAAGGNRTPDARIFNPTFYRLNYRGGDLLNWRPVGDSNPWLPTRQAGTLATELTGHPMPRRLGGRWWVLKDSNLRVRVETALQAAAIDLSAKHPMNERTGGGRRDRTDDLLLAKQLLSPLSYTPIDVSGHEFRRRSIVAADFRPRGVRSPRASWSWCLVAGAGLEPAGSFDSGI